MILAGWCFGLSCDLYYCGGVCFWVLWFGKTWLLSLLVEWFSGLGLLVVALPDCGVVLLGGLFVSLVLEVVSVSWLLWPAVCL